METFVAPHANPRKEREGEPAKTLILPAPVEAALIEGAPYDVDIPMTPPGRTMIYWLARVCRVTRERTGTTPRAMAEATGLSPSTIYRFEEGHTWPRKIPPERIVQAYASLNGNPDSRSLWKNAHNLWMQHGQPPGDDDDVDDLIDEELDKP